MTRIDHATLIAHRGGEPVVLPDHSIVVDGSKIRAVLPTHVALDPRLGYATAQEVQHLGGVTHPTSPAVHIDEVVDASRHIVIPGLVNAHHHLYQSLTRGLKAVQDAPLFGWLTALYERWRFLDFDAVNLASQISIAELLLSGCTTTNDHFYIFPKGSDVGAARRAGCRRVARHPHPRLPREHERRAVERRPPSGRVRGGRGRHSPQLHSGT